MAGLLDSIYARLPVFGQHAAVSAYGFYWLKRKYGGIFKQEFKRFKEREGYSPDQWRSYQTGKLRQVLVHAFENVPYYNRSFKAANFSMEQLKKFELDRLNQLPVLDKNDLRKYGKTDLLSISREKSGQFYASSGSTGTPTEILYSAAMHQRLTAAYESRVRNWAGVDRFHSRAMIGGRRVLPEGRGGAPYYRYNLAEKQLYLSAYHISRSTATNYLEGINKYKSDYMVGYAMSNFFLARFLDELGVQAPTMKAVITSSEKLTPAMRSVFSRVYGCKSYDGWSGIENCGLISESEQGQLLVSPDVGILEVLKSDGAAGETGELVCTGFLNFDQPLIRYRIGDLVSISSDQSTRCGRSMVVIDEIVGRLEDVVIGKDGREIVRFHGIFVNLNTVAEAQLVQLAVDRFQVNLVPIGSFSNEDKQRIFETLVSQLGEINLSFKEVESIPRNQNGKFKAVISHVNRQP